MADGIHAAMKQMKAAASQPGPDRAAPDPGGEQLPSSNDTVLLLGQARDHAIAGRLTDAVPMRRTFSPYSVLNVRRVGHGAMLAIQSARE